MTASRKRITPAQPPAIPAIPAIVPATVFGLDLSLTNTGLSAVGAAGASAWSRSSTGARDDDLATRRQRLHRLSESILEDIRNLGILPGDIAVIENPAFGAPGGSTWDRAGLWWLVVDGLRELAIGVATVAPSTRCLYATGNGRADKAAVAMAAARLFPDTEIKNSDEADALILAHMGAVRSGLLTGLARHAQSALTMKWPTEQTLAAAA